MPADPKAKTKAQEAELLEDEELEEEEEDGSDADGRALTAGKGRATPSRRQQAEAEEDKGNFIQRTVRGLAEYFEGVRSELKKVTWPTREETRRLSIIVIIALIISSIVLGTISLLFTELFRIGLNTPLLILGVMFIGIAAGVVYSRMASKNTSSF